MSIAEYQLPHRDSGTHDIMGGPDGCLWFCEFNGNRIGRIDPQSFAIEEFPLPHLNSGPRIMAIGPDGNIWFTENLGNRIGRISPDGAKITEFAIPTADSQPRGIKAGPDGNLWFAESNGNQIGRITPRDKSQNCHFLISKVIRAASQPVPTETCGSLRVTETALGASLSTVSSPNSSFPIPIARLRTSRLGQTERCGLPSWQEIGSDEFR